MKTSTSIRSSGLSTRVALLALAVAPLLVLARPVAAQEEDGERLEVAERRAAFRSVRADANGNIPDDYWSRAWRQMREMPPYQPASAIAAATLGWRPLGPFGMFGNQINFGGIGQLVAGRVTSIAVHPTDPQQLWVGAASGGVWKSTNGGTTWNSVTDGQCSPSIGAMAVDPRDPSYVYAGTGEINTFEFGGCGVLRSSDGGASWNAPFVNAVGPYHGKIVVDPVTAGTAGQTTLMAATSGGLFVSNNSGATWTLKVTGVAWSVVAAEGRPGYFYAAVFSSSRTPRTTIFRSTDGGATWSALPTPLSNTLQVGRIDLATSKAAPNAVIAFTADYNTRKFTGLYRWDEGGQSWTTLAAAGLVTTQGAYPFTIGEQSEYNLVVAMDPRNANRIWVAGVGAFASEDGGATFRSVARTVHVDWHAIVFSPSNSDQMYAGTDGGLYVSYDAGRTWRAQNAGLAIAQFYPGISIHPAGTAIFGGLQDNQALYFSGSPVWNNLSSMGDGGYAVVDYSDPSTVYITHAFLNFINRRKGLTESSRSFGISSNDRRGTGRPLVIDPVTPSTLYFGTQRLYRTTNGGLLWTPLTLDLTRGSGYITTIAIAPSNPLIIYVGTSDGVIARTLDGGLTWNQAIFSVNRRFTRILVHPTNPLRAIATAATSGAPKITQTLDGGLTFSSAISSSFSDIPVHSAAFLPGATIMAGTELGVLMSQDDGATWTQGPSGLPVSVVYDLGYAPATSTLVASTYGRGMFAIKVGAETTVLRGDVDADGSITAADALAIQQALVGVDIAPLVPYPRGDASCDGKLDGLDALLALQAAVGIGTPGQCVGTMARPVAAVANEGVTVRAMVGVGR